MISEDKRIHSDDQRDSSIERNVETSLGGKKKRKYTSRCTAALCLGTPFSLKTFSQTLFLLRVRSVLVGVYIYCFISLSKGRTRVLYITSFHSGEWIEARRNFAFLFNF